MPIYKVTVEIQDAAKQTRLIESKNEARAIAHAVAWHITCEKCSVAEAVKLGAEGVEIEQVAG